MRKRPSLLMFSCALLLGFGGACGLLGGDEGGDEPAQENGDEEGGDEAGGDEAADGRSVEERLRGLPSSERVDPVNDEILNYIITAVEGVTDDQMLAIDELYIQLRDDQYALIEGGGAGKGGGKAGKGGGKAGKGGGKAGKGGGRAGKGGGRAGEGGDMGASRQLTQLNDKFLADGRALMNSDQHNSWDDCAALVNLNPPEVGARAGSTVTGGPTEGDRGPDFTLRALDGSTLDLGTLRGKPVVVEFGSYTCPSFRKEAASLEVLRRQYADDAHFVLVYGYEAHTTDGNQSRENTEEGILYPSHKTMQDRERMANLAVEELGLGFTVVLDNMDDGVTGDYAGHPNRGYILDADGKIVDKQQRLLANEAMPVLQGLL